MPFEKAFEEVYEVAKAAFTGVAPEGRVNAVNHDFRIVLEDITPHTYQETINGITYTKIFSATYTIPQKEAHIYTDLNVLGGLDDYDLIRIFRNDICKLDLFYRDLKLDPRMPLLFLGKDLAGKEISDVLKVEVRTQAVTATHLLCSGVAVTLPDVYPTKPEVFVAPPKIIVVVKRFEPHAP